MRACGVSTFVCSHTGSHLLCVNVFTHAAAAAVLAFEVPMLQELERVVSHRRSSDIQHREH